MNVPSFAKYALGVAAAAGVLVACSGGGTQPTLPSGPGANYSPSGMTPDGPKGALPRPLIYVTDQDTESVYVLTYPGGKLVQTLTGFSGPEGICADNKGHIFVVNGSGQNIVEYKRGGTSPIATIKDYSYYPKSCAVDPTTGDLAVTNETTLSNTQGNIAIYPNASGTPKIYSESNMFYYMFCGYDSAGNFYVDGYTTVSATSFAFAKLPKGAPALTAITLNKVPSYPGGVAWDGKHVTVGDPFASPNVINRYKIAGSTGTEIGSTPLNGTYRTYEYVFWPKTSPTLIVPNIEGSSQNKSDLQYYKYPAGGSPTQTFTFGGQFVAYAALSP